MSNTKVLLVGSGAREHALGDALIAGGAELYAYLQLLNPGIREIAKKFAVGKDDDTAAAVRFAKENSVEIALIGPETPLAAGIVDELEKAGIRCIGPTKKLAQLETSKGFTRQLLKKHGIEGCPDFRVFNSGNKSEMPAYLEKLGEYAVKPDGLTGGKGVKVFGEHLNNHSESLTYCEEILREHSAVVVEEKLEGEEFSMQTLTDGNGGFLHFPAVQDHKRAFDGDTGPNCYSSDTEILTKEGWLTFDKLKNSTKVAVVSPKKMTFWFEKPKKVYWMKYKGKLVSFKNRNIDLLVTPNHRMLLEQRKYLKRKFVIEAKDYKGEHYIYNTAKFAIVNKKQDPRQFILPGYDYKFNRRLKKVKIGFLDWLKFLGIYLSEGFVSMKEKRVYICQTKKSRHIPKIRKILSGLPFAHSYDKKYGKFRINSAQLSTYLKQFGTSHNKFVPEYVKNSSRRAILEFLMVFCIGDGDIHNGKMRFCSSSKRIADDLQELILRTGFTSIITTDKRKTMVNPINHKVYAASPIYALEMKKAEKSCIRKNHFKKVNYTGYVGCVEVSTGFVIVRRTGRIVISGNTGGMGSYSDANFLLPFLTATDVEAAKKITEKVAVAIRKELGEAYKGVMFGGFMKTAAGIKLLEYNARFGDPEAMDVIPLLKTNFVEICKAVVAGKLASLKVEFEKKATVCKYVVPQGYPDKAQPGKIEVPSVEKDFIKALVYYGAVEEKEDGIYTTKSRAVAFVGVAETIAAAEKIAEEAASMVNGKVYHRKDIGTHELVQKRVEHIKALTGQKRLKQLYRPKDSPMRVAAFMSGTGSNLRKIMELQQRENNLFKVVMIFSDTADESACNARKIAGEYKIPYYCNDMREYYARRGQNSRKDMKIREEYDTETAKLARMHKANVVALCGYMSILTKPIIENFLTLNVHPADLRIKDGSGHRKYAGCMGQDCVKKAILAKEKEIRAATHIVTDELDGGQVLLVSKPVKTDGSITRSGNNDELEKTAHSYHEKLKEEGDWKIYPETLKMLAQGRLAKDDTGMIYLDEKPIPDGKEMR